MKKILIIILVILVGLFLFFVFSGKSENLVANTMLLSIKKAELLTKAKDLTKDLYTDSYRFSTRKCYDGLVEINKDSTSCKTSLMWRGLAENFCAGHCNKEGTKCGLNSFSVTNPCQPTEPTGFRFSTRKCYDGLVEIKNDPTSCKPSTLWLGYAENFCAGHCNKEGTKCGLDSFSVTNSCYVK